MNLGEGNPVYFGYHLDLLLESQLSLIRPRLVPNRGRLNIHFNSDNYDSGNQSSCHQEGHPFSRIWCKKPAAVSSIHINEIANGQTRQQVQKWTEKFHVCSLVFTIKARFGFSIWDLRLIFTLKMNRIILTNSYQEYFANPTFHIPRW